MNTPDARFLIDQAIQRLIEVREKVTESNARFFNIKMEQKRKLDPIYLYGQPIGFRQEGPETLEIIVEDLRKEGCPL